MSLIRKISLAIASALAAGSLVFAQGIDIQRGGGGAIRSGTSPVQGSADQSICFADGSSGTPKLNCADATFKYLKATGALSATSFTGAVSGNATTATNLSGTFAAHKFYGNATGSTTAPAASTIGTGDLPSAVVAAITNDTNVTGSVTSQNLTLGWTGTLAAARLNSSVVQGFTNDTNVTGSVTAQNATLGWTGTLAATRGGFGADVSGQTGIPQISGGTFSFGNISEAQVTNLVTDLANIAGGQSQGGATGTFLSSGCGVFYSGTGFIYNVAACNYFINGVPYTSPSATVTFSAADATNDRVDDIVVNTTPVATNVTGTASANPSEPSLDPALQIKLISITISANSTTPSGVTNEIVYDENDDWATTCGTGWSCASTTNPHTGTKDVQATSVAAGTNVKFIRSATLDPNAYALLTFWIRNKAAWNSGRSLVITMRDTNAVQKGNAIVFGTQSFGFDNSNTSSYQLITVPISGFAIPSGTAIKELRIEAAGSGGSAIGFYLDDIVLQGNNAIQQTTGITQAQGDARWLPAGLTYVLQERGSTGLLAASSFSANAANMYAANARYASSSGALQLGIPSGATPTILDSAASSGGSGGTTFSVTLPSTRIPGDLLLSFVIEQDQSGAPVLTGWPSGWTLSLTAGTAAFTGRTRLWIAYKVADGSETDFTLTATQALNGYSTKTYRISNFVGTPEITTTSAASTANPDPPSLTPSWGSANNLWFAFTWFGNGTATASGFPSGYSNTFASTAVGASYAMGIASRSATTATENPATFTLTGAEDTGSGTLAIRPAGSGSTQAAIIVDATTGIASPAISTAGFGITDGSTYSILEKDSTGKVAASSWSANGANLYAANGRVASSSGALQLGIPSGGTPTISSQTSTSTTGSCFGSASPAVNIPSGVLANDMLLAFISGTGGVTLSGFPTGWTSVGTATQSNSTTFVYYKIADGTETNFTVTATGGAPIWVSKTYRLSNFDSSVAPGFAGATGSTAAPDSPNLTPSWGSANNLWFSYYTANGAGGVISSYPGSYTNTDTLSVCTAGSTRTFGVATRNVTGSSENPAAFAILSGADWSAVTVAVKPAGSGSTQVGALIDTDGSVNTIAGANNLSLVPKASGTPVAIVASGTDTNVGINFIPKGSGAATVNGTPIPFVAGSQYALQENNGSSGLAASSFSANLAIMYAANAQYASSSGALQLGIPSGSSPIVAETVAQSSNGTSTPTIPMPTTFNANEMLMWCLVGMGSGDSITGGTTGWTSVVNVAPGGNAGHLYCYYKIATGSESPFTVTTTNTTSWVARIWRITSFDVSQAPAAATAGNSASGTPDPPSLTPSWGSANNLWFALGDPQDNCTGYPTNYTDNQSVDHGSANYYLCASTRTVTNATENPTTYTTVNTTWSAATIAIKPAGAGSTQTGWNITTAGTLSQMATVNGFNLVGAAAAASPAIQLRGSDTNVSGSILTKGTGAWTQSPTIFDSLTAAIDALIAKDNGVIVFDVLDNTSTVLNGLSLKGGATGVNPLFTALGETNVGFDWVMKGTGNFRAQHFAGRGTAPTITASGGTCGTSDSIAGTDSAGTVTVGTGTPSSCVITFNATWASAPKCFVNDQTQAAGANVRFSATTTTTATIALAATNASDAIDYWCVDPS